MSQRGPDPEAVRAWVEASCAAQGLPVTITDSTVLGRVAGLLGAPPRKGRGPTGAAPGSDLPDRGQAARIETVRASDGGGGDGQVVEHGGDDRMLPGEGQVLPAVA